MTTSIPVNIIEGWITDLKSILRDEASETKIDPKITLGMRHGLDQIRSRLTTWCRHQKYVQTLNRLGRKFLLVRRVNLSHGNYRKLEWYEGDQFITLAWRHARDEAEGELMLEIQETGDLSTEYLVYQGGSSFDDLAGLARVGGLDSIKTERNRQEWVEKVWP
jgi:hypothetical protein